MDRNSQPTSSLGKKLTPIHMRGKRKSNRSPASFSSSQANNIDSDTAAAAEDLSLDLPSSPRKRSREPDPGRGSSSATVGSKAPARRPRTQKNASFDQRFPLEVIERIFFYSKNYNLPVANARLGWMLSSRHTLRDLVLDALGPYWNLTLVKGYKEPKPGSPAAAKKKRAVRSSTITALLACPWAKMDLLVEAQQVWLQKNRTKGKRYVHTIIPFTEDPDMDIARKFVLNMDGFDTLIENHVKGHILSIELLDSQGRDSDENGDDDNDDDYYDDKDDGDNNEKDDEEAGNGQDGDKDAYEDVEEDNEGDGETEDDQEQPPQKSIKTEPENASAHACFALDQYFALETICRESPYDPKPGEDPMMLLESSPSEPRGEDDEIEEISGIQLLFFRMSISAYRRGPSLGSVRIPEWLQLAGGPYPANQCHNKEGRKAMRDRLRSTYDMLSWIIFTGGQLQKKESWETTWQGFQNLLEVDVRAHPWDAYEENEDVVAVHHSNNGRQPPTDKPIRLQYGVDTLVAGLLGHFYALGVFYRQWPENVVEEAMRKASDFGNREGGSFRKTQTYIILQRIALVVPSDRSEGEDWLTQTWQELKF
ncbi:hypothetical protein SEUCBS139899_001613 [Sporothrix eucalyptigena]|uniref:Uncharacterized protein n=1 Tax=Sporothrix eucalyptigena TaxID=1812306 RepID=A0ABP0BMP4_9PEZI